MEDSGQYAQRNGDQHCSKDGQACQKERGGKLRRKGPEHVPAGDIAFSHVAPQHSAQPVHILLQKGLVQPQFLSLGVDDLLGDRASGVGIQFFHRVAPREPHHPEGQESDADQHRDELYESSDDIFAHVVSCLFSEVSCRLRAGTRLLTRKKAHISPCGEMHAFMTHLYKILMNTRFCTFKMAASAAALLLYIIFDSGCAVKIIRQGRLSPISRRASLRLICTVGAGHRHTSFTFSLSHFSRIPPAVSRPHPRSVSPCWYQTYRQHNYRSC